jgi:hypothetical protein
MNWIDVAVACFGQCQAGGLVDRRKAKGAKHLAPGDLRYSEDSLGSASCANRKLVYTLRHLSYPRTLFYPFSQSKATTMAKRAAGEKPNKSEEIRKLIKTGAKPAEVQTTLAKRGIKVSTGMVYTVRSKMRARKSARKIGQRRAAVDSSAPPTDIKTLARFIQAVQEVGGVAAARGVLKELEK